MTTPTTQDLARTEITEDDTRATRLAILEARVCVTRDAVGYVRGCGDPYYAFQAVEELATLLQHTLQELAHLAWETSPR